MIGGMVPELTGRPIAKQLSFPFVENRAGELVRLARTTGSFSQRALSARAGIPQPNIAAIESDSGRGATVDTLDRLVRAAGCQLAVLPTTLPTAAHVATEVAHHLRARHEDRAYRRVIGLHDSLVRADAALRVALVVTPPPSTGDVRWDALIAGVVAFDLNGLPQPTWVHDPDRKAGGWFVDDVEELHDEIRRRTPPAFERRGVFIDAHELASV